MSSPSNTLWSSSPTSPQYTPPAPPSSTPTNEFNDLEVLASVALQISRSQNSIPLPKAKVKSFLHCKCSYQTSQVTRFLNHIAKDPKCGLVEKNTDNQ